MFTSLNTHTHAHIYIHIYVCITHTYNKNQVTQSPFLKLFVNLIGGVRIFFFHFQMIILLKYLITRGMIVLWQQTIVIFSLSYQDSSRACLLPNPISAPYFSLVSPSTPIPSPGVKCVPISYSCVTAKPKTCELYCKYFRSQIYLEFVYMILLFT